jgi:hypothetical protein
MVRLFLAIVIVAFAHHQARSQPVTCVDPTQSWAWQYQNDKIQFITYYLDTQILSVAYRNGIFHLANKVPLGVAQKFETLGYGVSPDKMWNGIRGSYLEILQAQDHCPLLAQNGAYLLSVRSLQDAPNQ